MPLYLMLTALLLGPTDYKVAAGTSLSIEIRVDLDSQTAKVGDQVDGRLTLALFSGGKEVVPASAPIYGAVTAVRPASKDDRGQIEIRFSALEHPETHSRVGIRATPIVVDAPPDPPKKRFHAQEHNPARLARGSIVYCSLLDPFVVRLPSGTSVNTTPRHLSLSHTWAMMLAASGTESDERWTAQKPNAFSKSCER